MKDFSGKVAVVTGAASGMGDAMAWALAREGCKVIVADIMEAGAKAVAEGIERSGGSAASVPCDISDRASVRALKAETNRIFGPASLVIANAGVTIFKRLTEMSDQEIDWVLEVDLHGVFHCLQIFLPDMISAREGHVVATSSFAGLLAPYIDLHAPYVAAKAGVIGLMLSMRRELEGSGVGTTVLCPGKVDTRITESFKYRPERFGGPTNEPITLPLGADTQPARDPNEVAQMVLHAVRADRAVVVTDSSAREYFRRGYSDLILSAFDDADDWDKAQR